MIKEHCGSLSIKRGKLHYYSNAVAKVKRPANELPYEIHATSKSSYQQTKHCYIEVGFNEEKITKAHCDCLDEYVLSGVVCE